MGDWLRNVQDRGPVYHGTDRYGPTVTNIYRSPGFEYETLVKDNVLEERRVTSELENTTLVTHPWKG